MEKINVYITEFEKSKNLKGYTAILGFPGLGLVGPIGAKYLIEKLKLKKFGCIESDVFIPIIRVRDGKPVHPSRIFIDTKKKLLIIHSEQIIPKNHSFEFAKELAHWLKRKKIIKVVSLNGIQIKNSENKKTYGIGSLDKSINFLKKFDVKPIQEGITSGITALTLLELKKAKFDAISLLAPVSLSADYKAAAQLIEKLNEIMKWKIDVKPLLSEAKRVEKELTTYMKKLREQEKDITEHVEPSTPSYTA